MKIYTKKGDGGETSLYSGGRVRKDDLRIEAYGTVDELNAALGLLSTDDLPAGAVDRLREVQSVLFSIGSDLADPEGKLESSGEVWPTDALEAWTDEMDADLDELRAFILPGGCREAALAHVARTVCRRAERRIVALGESGAGVLPYLNRLSDTLFVLGRYLNARRGIPDIEWTDGR